EIDTRKSTEWLELKWHGHEKIVRPDEIRFTLPPSLDSSSEIIQHRIQGSLLAMAVGDALGVPFESAMREHMLNNPVTDSMIENRRKSHHWNHVLKEAEKTPTNAEVCIIPSETEPVTSDSALMRLAPIPLFFYRSPKVAVYYSGESCRLTFEQNGKLAIDICRYYGALIVAALHGEKKEELLHNNFYERKFQLGWFGNEPLHEDVLGVAHGGDTDTSAAIYGMLAGAYYGVEAIDKEWIQQLYASQFIGAIALWLDYEGLKWFQKQ
ncbi:unnamed protein product, partial [Rotaria sordida]